jgi:hypothetical protein
MKVNPKEMYYGRIDWIQLALDAFQWQTILKTGMNLRAL